METYLAVLAVTSTSISIPGQASAVTTRNVPAGWVAPRVRLGAAFAGVEEISDVRNISDDLVDVVDGCAMLIQQPFDLVPGIPALRTDIAEVADDAAL